MTTTSVLRATAAAVLATTALALAPAAAFAADAAITTDSDVYAVSDVVAASGTCPDSAASAVVEITQAGASIGTASTDVAAGAWSVDVDVDGQEGTAAVTVSCLDYGSSTPVDTAATSITLLEDIDFVDVPVTVAPTTVAIGADVTVTAACPAGATTASVLLGNTDADDAFAAAEATPAADGTVSFTVPVTGEDPAPESGDAVAVVFCEGDSFGFGQADFTIAAVTPVPSTPATPVADDDQLAATGTQAGRLAQIAFMLIVAGAAAVFGARRFQRVG